MQASRALARGGLVGLLAILGTAGASLRAETVPPSPYWRNAIQFPGDSFRKAGPDSSEPGWIKFLIFTSDPTRVYFQDSNRYLFHYDFAKNHVSEYANLTTEEFDAITLFATGRQAILGTIVLPYWASSLPAAEQVAEYGIEFVGRDAYSASEIVSLFNLVKSKVTAAPNVQAFYFPAYEQMAAAEENRAFLETNGVTISSAARWAKGNIAYAMGWAVGALKQYPAAEIADAYRRGDLAPDDILLTSGVPADMPIVAGIISLTPSTPNSHVAILAETYHIPFVFLALASDATRAQSLVGRKIALRLSGNANACDARLIDMQDAVTPQQLDEILALKRPAPLNITPMAPRGAYSASTDGLWPADIRYFGGKAANMGLLRRSIPAHSPVSLGLSFDVWNEFLDQTLAGGRTLREEIAFRLQGFTYPPANMSVLSAALEGIRENLFKKTSATHFSPALQAAILGILQDPQYGFDPVRRIRFRSSSNAEDSAQFTAAGLYDSYSGCLADELDGDEAGPSRCDASESSERGVFRAIRRVFASFYNDNAYLGRLKYGIDESQVGMGILVHHSTPDEFEWANGVAVLVRSTLRTDITLVTQNGAVSVTNPGDGSIPEEIEIKVYSFGTYFTIKGYSNLVPHGATVLTWDSEYRTLVNLLTEASTAFRQASGKASYKLDFEYKKVAPDGALRIKQIRELPLSTPGASVAAFLVNEPTAYETYQGETSDVFAQHRLKSRWTMTTRSMWLTPANLSNDSIFTQVSMEYADSDGAIRTRSGVPGDWSEAVHAYQEDAYGNTSTTDSWVFDDMTNPRRYTLITSRVAIPVPPSQCPLLTLRDLGVGSGLVLGAEHDRPVPTVQNASTRSEAGTIRLPLSAQAGDLLQSRVLAASGISIDTQFYWPPRPPVAAGYTAPLARWVQTRISGCTKVPFVLRGYYAQTYRPEHHNFSEHFLFEPQLDPDLPTGTLQELRTRNIRLIHAYMPMGSATITTYGFSPGADMDGNGTVNLLDAELFQACATGPGTQATLPWGCRSPDFDRDGDVDQSDFGVFQRCLSGDSPADPGCAE